MKKEWRAHVSSCLPSVGLGFILMTGIASADDITTISLVEHAAGDTVTDIGEKGDSAGDILTYANDIYDKDNAKKMGTDNGWCIRTVAGKAWECSFSLMLEDGQITAEGPFFDAADSVLVVTGGAGKYAGKHGEMALHARNKEGTEFDFVFTLRD